MFNHHVWTILTLIIRIYEWLFDFICISQSWKYEYYRFLIFKR